MVGLERLPCIVGKPSVSLTRQDTRRAELRNLRLREQITSSSQVLFQQKKTSVEVFLNGGLGETRTLDQLIKSQLLYQLSYKPFLVHNTLLKNFFQVIFIFNIISTFKPQKPTYYT